MIDQHPNNEKEKTPMANAIDKIKKLYSASTVEKKDLSLKDLMNQEGGKKGEIVVKLVGLSSKYVPKYHTEDNDGIYTMMYFEDGRKVGAFSNALKEFATFFYRAGGLDPASTMNRINFGEGNVVEVKISRVDLDKGRTTYNFDVIGGELEFDRIEMLGQSVGAAPLLLSDGK